MLESARRPSPAMQDDAARVVLSFTVEDGPLIMLAPEEDEALALSGAADKSAGVKITRHRPGPSPHQYG